VFRKDVLSDRSVLLGSGKLGVFGVDETGRKGQAALLSAHADFVTDFGFSPFHHSLLATASEDSLVSANSY